MPLHRIHLPDHHRRLRPGPGHRLQRQRPGHLGHRPAGPAVDICLHRAGPDIGDRPDDPRHHLHLRPRLHRQPSSRQRPAHHHQPQRPARRPRRRRRDSQRLQHCRAGHHPDRPHGLQDNLQLHRAERLHRQRHRRGHRPRRQHHRLRLHPRNPRRPIRVDRIDAGVGEGLRPRHHRGRHQRRHPPRHLDRQRQRRHHHLHLRHRGQHHLDHRPRRQPDHPGSSTASYLKTTYSLYKGNSITLGSTGISCTTAPPSNSLPCATINADGVVTQLGYNSAGDLTSSAAPDGNGSEITKATYGYDGDGEQTSKISPDGNLSGANAGNYTTITAYNADGEQTTVTQAGGTGATVTPRATTSGYDANGNTTTVQDARGYTTTTTYNADDKPALVTDPVGNATLTCYDGGGHTTETVPPVGVAAGSLTPASCPASYPSGYGFRLATDATTYAYDAAGNKTATTTPAPAGQTGSETTTSAYDGDANVIKITAPPATGSTSQVTVDTYTSTGKQATQTTGYGTSAASTTSYCYDPNGQATSVVMPDGNTGGTAGCETASPWVVSSSSYPTQAGFQTTSAYDSAGELVSTTSPATAAAPSGATTTATFDAAGNTLTRTDPNGVITTWTYTPLNLTATVSYSGSSAHSVSYTYDANGQKTAMTDATGSSSYIWDPFGELTSAANGAGKTVGYSYDADGDTTGVTYPLPGSATWAATGTVAYGYNHADVLTSLTDFNNHQITITPNADSLPASETLGSTGDTITATYDLTDRPSAIALKNGSTTLQSFTYSNAPASNILSETDTPSSSKSPAAYTYDAQGRVISMTPG